MPCVIVYAEKEPPYDVAVRVVDPNALYNGRLECAALLKRLAECRASDKWPGRYEEIGEIDLPAWFYSSPEAQTSTDPEWMVEEGI